MMEIFARGIDNFFAGDAKVFLDWQTDNLTIKNSEIMEMLNRKQTEAQCCNKILYVFYP